MCFQSDSIAMHFRSPESGLIYQVKLPKSEMMISTYSYSSRVQNKAELFFPSQKPQTISLLILLTSQLTESWRCGIEMLSFHNSWFTMNKCSHKKKGTETRNELVSFSMNRVSGFYSTLHVSIVYENRQ